MTDESMKVGKIRKASCENVPSKHKRVRVFNDEHVLKSISQRSIQNQQASRQSDCEENKNVLSYLAVYLETLGTLCLNYSKKVQIYNASLKHNLSTEETVKMTQHLSKESEEVGTSEPKKKRGSIDMSQRECDESGSRWTLKHQQFGPGLIKVYGYNVFIERNKLEDILYLSNNGATFARLLLPLIFSENALAACTLNGEEPCLDPDGLKALFSCVRCAEIKQAWPPVEKKDLEIALIDKLLTEKRKLNGGQPQFRRK